MSMRRQLDRTTYHLRHDLALRSAPCAAPIEHLVVSRYGIVVLKVVQMNGAVFASDRHALWTHKKDSHARARSFANPLLQSHRHTKALEAVLELPPQVIHSIVIFVGDISFKTPIPENVTQGDAFIRKIKSMREPVFNDAWVNAILLCIDAHTAQARNGPPTAHA